MRARALVAVVAALLISACGGSDSATPTGSDPTIARATTTTTDAYAVPEVIDAAYVNRVLAGLARVEGDVLRIAIREKALPQEARDRLRAIYASDAWLEDVANAFLDEVRSDFSGINLTPGDKYITVVALRDADPHCVFAEVAIDYSATALEPISISGGHWVVLVPTDPGTDPGGHNPTGWSYEYDGFPLDGTEAENLCVELLR